MRSSDLRVALILLLALLLPLKGMAAWAMAGCAAAPAVAVVHATVSERDLVSPLPCHGDAAVAADTDMDSNQPTGTAHSACSHTSPCCAAVMVAPALDATAPAPRAHAVWVAAPPCADLSVPPVVLERPPKRLG